MTPTVIENLPLLDRVLARYGNRARTKPLLERTLLVANQHLLPSNCAFFKALMALGIQPSHMVVTGKMYSTRPAVTEWLHGHGVSVVVPSHAWPPPGSLMEAHNQDLRMVWDRGASLLRSGHFDRVLVVDDGGYGLLTMPEQIAREYPVVAIEQTTSGLAMMGLARPRRINVAGCAAKCRIEPSIISESIVRAIIDAIGEGAATRFGVIGLGNVGRAVASRLASEGRLVSFCDRRGEEMLSPPTIGCVSSLRALCQSADVIIGCTGEDVFAGADWLDQPARELVLISASSQDVEFRSLLLRPSRSDLRPDASIPVRVGKTLYRVLFGGYPINFSGAAERECPRDIQLTRALLLAAVLQAIVCPGFDRRVDNWTDAEKLNPALQRFVVQSWSELRGEGPDRYSDFSSLEWIAAQSKGVFTECKLSEIFA